MKKIRIAIVMVLALSMLFGTTAFAASASANSTNGVTAVNEWSANNRIDGNMFLIVEVRNDNSKDVAVYMNAYSMTSSGNVIEETQSDTVVLEADGRYALVAAFSDPASAAATNYDYELVVDKKVSSSGVYSATKNVDARFSDNGKGTATIYATNTSSYNVTGTAMIIWYKNDKIVDFQEMFLSSDADYDMAPGEATTEKVYTDQSYDSTTLLVTAVR